MKRVKNAKVAITCNVECPYCDHEFDILNDCGWDYFDGVMPDLIDEGNVGWRERIECPECEEEFIVENVYR